MRLSREEVEHVALLGRLELSEEEVEHQMEALNQILEAFAQLQELDTEEVEPTSHVIPMSNVFRPDEPRPSLSREEALANAPEQEEGCFRVPRVVE
ncbi:MAG TPA: Asp-tRNA(Asn)/Glu-tRNA(Gln) amidotransferase subunit GatC [Armatimonadetes bacterium]|nr:Asp-tRNA(Asn)/Glu-tRNA(Gln) amidotransferase subunit GatC [Armatimonadota bacterium]